MQSATHDEQQLNQRRWFESNPGPQKLMFGSSSGKTLGFKIIVRGWKATSIQANDPDDRLLPGAVLRHEGRPLELSSITDWTKYDPN